MTPVSTDTVWQTMPCALYQPEVVGTKPFIMKATGAGSPGGCFVQMDVGSENRLT